MQTHPFPRALSALSLIALLLGPSCAGQPLTAPSPSRAPLARSGALASTKPPAASDRRSRTGRPDPRYRPPQNFAELQTVAGEVAKASGRKVRWRLVHGANPGPLVTIRGNVNDCTIYIHPVAARKVPPNTWAFIFGHEFAHLLENLGTHSQTSPANELKADIAGARYAMAAGYRIEAFLGWVLTEPNQQTHTHGALHKRVQSIAAHFRIPQSAIQAQAQRAKTYRAKH